MANELKHGSVGTELTQAEWEGIGTHVLESQAAGDIIYASTTAQLSRLGIGSDTHVLTLASGLPSWAAPAAAAAGSLTGSTLASGVTASSLTSVGTLSGDLQLNGDLDFVGPQQITTSSGAFNINPATTLDIDLTANTSSATTFNDGTTNYYKMDTRTTSSSDVHVWDASQTGRSASTESFLRLYKFNSAVFEYVGTSGAVTPLFSTMQLQALTIQGDTATQTVNKATGLEIVGPTEGSNVTLSHVSGLRILNPAGTPATISGLYVEAQTSGATSSYGISVEDASTAGLWLSSNTDSTDAAGGILFGSSGDTNLYRSAANVLTTDDTFVATVALQLAAPNTVAGTGLMLTTNNTSVQEVMRDSSTISLKSEWAPITLGEAQKLLDVTAGHYRMGGIEDSGFFVEDFERAGITDILAYTEGKPTAFKTFGRGIAAYMLPLVQDYEGRIKVLENKLQTLEAK